MTVTYEVSRQFARRARRRYSWGTLGGVHTGVLIAALLGILGTVYGSELWVYGFLIGVGVSYGCTWWAISASAQRASRPLFNQQLTLTIDENALQLSADGFSSRFDWKLFTSLRRYNDMWLLTARGLRGPYAIPAHALPEGAKSMIERKLREVGGKLLFYQ